MSKNQLKKVYEQLTHDEQQYVEELIIKGSDSDNHGYSVDTDKLVGLGLIGKTVPGHYQDPVKTIYAGGPISEYFEVAKGI